MTEPTILIVDDEPANLAVLSQLLSPHYRVKACKTGEQALASLRKVPQPDLLLLDVMMPGMSGYEVLERMAEDDLAQQIPVIFVTALGGAADEERGFALGAVDYITKPIKPAVLRARVRTHLELKTSRDRLRDHNAWLEAEVARRLEDSVLIQDASLCALAELAETRDTETGNHILRTQAYVEVLARELQGDPAYQAELAESELQHIVKAAPLHDIGKVGIPDHILLKPGKLTPDEWVIMQSHAAIGGDTIDHAITRSLAQTQRHDDTKSDALRFLEVAKVIATSHHEKWDGSGYPQGLAGEEIPLAARLMALSDVFDALTTQRVYKPAWPLEKARDLILEQQGSHFDPGVVVAFERLLPAFTDIRDRLSDPAA